LWSMPLIAVFHGWCVYGMSGNQEQATKWGDTPPREFEV
jgi:hypothetical protein